jgi:hypothetical protein
LARIKVHMVKLAPILDLDAIHESQGAKESLPVTDGPRRPLERPRTLLALADEVIQ